MKMKLDFEIDSGEVFGTGNHPTTVLCLEMLERYLRKGDKFLDVGTGSGILMIAAAKLGAGKVCGIDRNHAAVEIARRNLIRNRIENKRRELRTGNLVEGVDEKYDLVAANILTEVILTLLDTVNEILTENGIFICSGMLERNTHRVEKRMKASGFEILETRTKDKWVAIACRFKRRPFQ